MREKKKGKKGREMQKITVIVTEFLNFGIEMNAGSSNHRCAIGLANKHKYGRNYILSA